MIVIELPSWWCGPAPEGVLPQPSRNPSFLLQDLGGGVVVGAGLPRHPVEPAAGVCRPLHQAEGPVRDGGEQSVLVVVDLLEQVDRLTQDLAGAGRDEAVGRG